MDSLNEIYLYINAIIEEKNVSHKNYFTAENLIKHEIDVEKLINDIKKKKFFFCIIKKCDQKIIISLYYDKDCEHFLLVRGDSPEEKFRTHVYNEDECFYFIFSLKDYIKKDFYSLG